MKNVFIILIFSIVSIPNSIGQTLLDTLYYLDGKIEVMIMTSISGETMDKILNDHKIKGTYSYVDGTVLKAMVRSNPGIMLIQDGTVMGKWHINDLPDAGDLAAAL